MMLSEMDFLTDSRIDNVLTNDTSALIVEHQNPIDTFAGKNVTLE